MVAARAPPALAASRAKASTSRRAWGPRIGLGLSRPPRTQHNARSKPPWRTGPGPSARGGGRLLGAGRDLQLAAVDLGPADGAVAAAVLGGVQRLVGAGDDLRLFA